MIITAALFHLSAKELPGCLGDAHPGGNGSCLVPVPIALLPSTERVPSPIGTRKQGELVGSPRESRVTRKMLLASQRCLSLQSLAHRLAPSYLSKPGSGAKQTETALSRRSPPPSAAHCSFSSEISREGGQL